MMLLHRTIYVKSSVGALQGVGPAAGHLFPGGPTGHLRPLPSESNGRPVQWALAVLGQREGDMIGTDRIDTPTSFPLYLGLEITLLTQQGRCFVDNHPPGSIATVAYPHNL